MRRIDLVNIGDRYELIEFEDDSFKNCKVLGKFSKKELVSILLHIKNGTLEVKK